MQILIALVAALTALATAGMVQVVFVAEWTHYLVPLWIPLLGGVDIDFLKWGIAAFAAYAVTNYLSGKEDQRHPVAYGVDHAGSGVAWLSIQVAAIVVAVRMIQTGTPIRGVSDLSLANILLVLLFAYSWYDFIWTQRFKREAVGRWYAAQRLAVAPIAVPPVPIPAPAAAPVAGAAAAATTPAAGTTTGGNGWAIFALFLGMIGLLILILALTGKLSGLKTELTSDESGKAVPICERYIKKNDDGVAIFHIYHDC